MKTKKNLKQRLLSGGVWSFTGKVVTALAGLGINVLLARLLTHEEMGAYFLTFSLVSVAAIVAQFGLTQTIVRLVAESMGTDRPARARQSVVLILKIVALSGLSVACLLAFGVGQWISEQIFESAIMSQIMGLAAVWAIIITFQSVIAEVYRGFCDIRLATFFGGLITSVLSMVLFIFLWLLQGKSNLDQILFLTLGAGFSSVFLSSLLLWDKLKRLPFEKNNVSLPEVLKISWPLWVINLILFVSVQIGLWLMGLFRSPEEVAVYGAASRTVALVAMPLLIVNAVVPPLIAEMHAQKKSKELESALRMTATLAGLPSLFILGLFIFFGGAILSFFFGEFYQVGGTILAMLSVGQLANVWAGSCGLVLVLTGYQITMLAITVCCGLFTVILAWLLVSLYGGIGVAIAVSSGMALQNLFMLLFAKRRVGIWTHMNPSRIWKVKSIL